MKAENHTRTIQFEFVHSFHRIPSHFFFLIFEPFWICTNTSVLVFAYGKMHSTRNTLAEGKFEKVRLQIVISTGRTY